MNPILIVVLATYVCACVYLVLVKQKPVIKIARSSAHHKHVEIQPSGKKRAFEEIGADEVFKMLPEVYGQKRLIDVKTQLLAFIGVWVIIGPVACIYAQIYVEEHRLSTIHIPADAFYWICGMGIVSILAFGFDLVNPRTLTQIGFRKPSASAAEYEMSLSGKFTPLSEDDTNDDY